MIITITHLDSTELHPLWRQYDGQVWTQPTFVELDTRNGSLIADYSGEVGGGVPEDVWNGKRRRYKIDPQLTCAEINALLDDVATALETDADADIEQLCAERTTNSMGVYEVGDWMEGIDPCEEYGITADTTDDELQKIAANMVDYATGEGATITGVAEYCENLRDELADG
jgi:hypothetical protein